MTAKMDTGLKKADRADIAVELKKVLADSFALYLKTHGYHWNVRGPQFFGLHNMLEQQYREQWAALDEIAERIRALGFPAPGTNSEFARLTSIAETPGVPEAREMVRLLVQGHEAVARTARKIFPAVEKANDQPTMDLLTQRLQVHEKTAWMLRSLLEN